MDRACVNCLKTLMILLNFICWLCGAFVVALGEFQMMNSRFGSMITSFWPIYPANTLVVTGTIVTCVCYLGILGTLKQSRCILIMFFVLLFILMLVELAMGCVFLVFEREIKTFFERDMIQSLEVYKHSTEEGDETLKKDFDYVQHVFKCCGMHGVADWGDNVPISCCTEDPCNLQIRANWQEGCLTILRNWFAKNFLSTGAGVICLFIIQFICMCFTVPLFWHSSHLGIAYH